MGQVLVPEQISDLTVTGALTERQLLRHWICQYLVRVD
jgi:hypothetical protein